MRLTRLVYFSRNKLDTSRGALADRVSEILAVSVANNRAADISGGLIFNGEYFLQALEGDAVAVQETVARIERDPRHSDICVIDTKSAGARRFGYWWMAAAGLTDANAEHFARYCGIGEFQPHLLNGTAACELIADVLEQQVKAVAENSAEAGWLSGWRTQKSANSLAAEELANSAA